MNMNIQNKRYIALVALFVVVALVLSALILSLPFASEIAYADSEAVFPSSGYMQSEAPSLIAANEHYLLIFDDAQHRLYVQSDTNLGDYDYVLNLASPDRLLAVGSKAFFVKDEHYYSLDLLDSAATLQDVNLATPDEISYFTTDGTYLYAQSAYGNISIYNDSFAIALGIDNARNISLTGNPTLVGDAATVHIFSSDRYGDHYITLNLSTGDKTEVDVDYAISAACHGDDAVIFASIGGEIVCIDKQAGDTLFSSGIEPDAFSAYGRNLFTIEGNTVKTYTISQDLQGLELVESRSMTGSDLGHFDHPTDVVKLSSKFAVADANNNRIAYYDGRGTVLTAFSLETSPKHLASNGNVLYIATDSQILELDSLYIRQRHNVEGVKDILYLDKLYVLKDDGVYILLSGSFEKLYNVNGAVCLACADDGTNVFVGTENEIIMLDPLGNKLPVSLTGDFTGLKDIAIDYAGNVIVAFDDSVKVFSNNLTALTPASTIALGGDLRATLNACELVGTELYFTTDESYLGKVNLDVKTKDNFVPATVADDVYTLDYTYKHVSDEATAHTLPISQRHENLKMAGADTLLVFDYQDAPAGFELAYDGLNLFYISTTGFEEVQTEALSGEYVAKETTLLYIIPHKVSGQNVEIASGTHVVFKRTTAGFDGNIWVVVEYDNHEYFALKDEFFEYVAPVPERKTNYGRAKGTRVGGIVYVYQSADETSAVILELADGAKVEILETLDDFYQVSIDGTIGYMRKDDVQLGGLTTVQIVSIILAVLVLLAGSTIFFAIYMTKKKSESN